MTHSLARGPAAVMDDAHRWYVRASRHAIQARAPVEVLEIQEKGRIESTRDVDRLAPDEHEAAADHGNGAHVLRALRADQVAQLVALEPAPEQPLQGSRREPAQREVEHRGIAFAEVL